MMLLLLAGSWMEWAETWLNYPGLEAWKFINLAVFLTAGIMILRRPLRAALVARQEKIRLQLAEAEKELGAAQTSLSEAEALVARIDTDVATLRDQAKNEAQMERRRLAVATDKEIEKMRHQAEREIETAGKVARKELQKFLAHRSVELAREAVRTQISADDDSRLIKEGIGQLRRTGA